MSDTFVGVDIAKAELVVACRPERVRWTAANEAEGIAATVARLRAMAPTLIVVEATGGMSERWSPRSRLRVCHWSSLIPRQVRDFANATGQLAKTDQWTRTSWPSLPNASGRRPVPYQTSCFSTSMH
jgi:transposase